MAPAKNTNVELDLDALERDGAPTPYPVRLGGKVYEIGDPKSIAWEDLASLTSGDNVHFLTPAVKPAQRDAFNTALRKLPGWKVDALADGYREHFNLPTAGEADASPSS